MNWPGTWRYALAPGAVLLATVTRRALDGIFGDGIAFITFYPAVAVVAMLAGGRAGLLTTAISALAAVFLFEQRGYRLTGSSTGDLVGLGLFLAAGVLISVTAGMLGRARKREWEAAEREKAGEKVRESEERLNFALEISQTGAWELDLRDHTAHRSPKHDRIFGYTAPLPRWTYEMFLEHVLPEDRALVDGKFRKAVEIGSDWTFECRIVRADQQVRWIMAAGRHRKDASGERCGLVGIVQDITERKEAEEKFQSERNLLETVVHHLPAAVNIFRATDFQILLVNPAYQVFAPGKVMLGKTMAEVWPELPGLPKIFREVAETGQPFSAVDEPYKIRRSENGPLEDAYFSWSLYRIPLPGDLGWGLLITAWETTARKKIEEALRESERRVRTFFESDMMGAIYWNMNGEITGANDKFLQMMGYSRQELIDGRMSWARMTPPEYRHLDEQAIADLKATGVDKPYEKEYLRKDGTRLPVLIGAAMLDERRFEGVAFVLDITERKKFQGELERLVAERTAKLKELVAELEHFSYTITHDMRAPLRAMQGFAELMSESCAACNQQETQGFLRRIRTSAARMDSLITDALNYSRTVRQELAVMPVDTGELLRGMLDTYPEFQPSKAQIEIKNELPLVLANEAGLTQCFSNILNNAVKFVKPGEVPRIRVRAELGNGWVRIWIEDDGIGIPKAMQPRVFDMFSRGHQNYGGTGIGLALVRKVMDRMGGKVGVESEENKGSRFWLELRAAEPFSGGSPANRRSKPQKDLAAIEKIDPPKSEQQSGDGDHDVAKSLRDVSLEKGPDIAPGKSTGQRAKPADDVGSKVDGN